MQKYMHTPDEKPELDRYIVTFRNNKVRMVFVTDPGWALTKPFIETWCYVDDILADLFILEKYIKAYSNIKDKIKEIANSTTSAKLKTQLTEICSTSDAILKEPLQE